MNDRGTNRVHEGLKAGWFSFRSITAVCNRIPARALPEPTAFAHERSVWAATTSLAVVLFALSGCFGPHYMKDDIEAYNRAAVASEQEMLLYNIGRLHYDQPPHFMMLSSVSQTRTFSAGGGFQWSQALAALNPVTAISNGVTATKTITTTSSNISTGSAWQAGPFTAGTVENPTITFVPIQGQEFANRFESPQREKFTLMLEDKTPWGMQPQIKALVLMFAQSLYLIHGPAPDGVSSGCQGSNVWYVNKQHDEERDQEGGNGPKHFYDDFSNCVKDIVDTTLFPVLIDGHYPVPTKTSTEPAAADAVTALGANYEWNQEGKDYKLTTPIRIPAWLDYNPKFVDPLEPRPKRSEPLPLGWFQNDEPDSEELTGYYLAKGYKWNAYPIDLADSRENSNQIYALLPDGYDLARDENGVLVKDRKNNYIPKKTRNVSHSASGRWTKGSPTITNLANITAEDVGRPISGPGIQDNTVVIAVSADTATMSANAESSSVTKITVGPHSARGTMVTGESKITDIDKISAEDVGSSISGAGIPIGTYIVAVNETFKTAVMSTNANSNGATDMTVGTHVATGRWTGFSPMISETLKIGKEDEGSSIVGPGIGYPATIKRVNIDPITATTTVTMSDNAYSDSTTPISIGDVDQSLAFSYADQVVDEVWPVQQNYIYFELRKGQVDDATAKDECHLQTGKHDYTNGVVCGYLKIGNLLEIMQRLGHMACSGDNAYEGECKEASFFGIGPKVPTWAEHSAQIETGQYVWEPAHSDPARAEIDRKMFVNLYKLYQLSLTDTSKLVSSAPPITISK
jgi:hypothetical protein